MNSVGTPKIAWPTVLGVVATVGVFSFVLDRRYDASLAAVHESLEKRAAIDETLSLLKDGETGQRGFILTGEESFLRPYEIAIERLPSPFQLSVSVGESVYDPHAPSALEALMESADRVMYEEKRRRARPRGEVERRA